MFFYSILIVLLTIVLTLVYHRYNRTSRLINKIPGPKAWPVIGNSLNYFLSPEKLFKYHRSLPKVYGNVNQIHGLNLRIVNLYDPDDIEKILSTNIYNYKEYPYTYLTSWLGQGLLVSNGNKWHQRRKILTKSFHFNILKKFMQTFVDETEEFLKKLEEETQKEKTELFSVISHATLRIMCETAMGVTVHDGIKSVMDYYMKALHTMGDTFTKRLARVWLHFDSIFQLTSIGKLQNSLVTQLQSFTNKVIEERRSYLTENVNQFDDDQFDDGYDSKKKLAMLDLLIKHEKSGEIDNDGIREEVDTFMFEGHDTTAIALTFMIMALANEPDVQEKLFSEMDQIFGDSDRLPTMEDLNEMKYLECCIKETIRMYPSAPSIMRCLTKDTNFGGYLVPANTICFICIYDVHHRADLYPEPQRFIPERFSSENSAKRHPYAFIPFSAGSRNCIGQKFAILEMKVMMCGLLRKYRLEPVTKPSEIVYKTDFVLRTINPVYAKFRLRK